MTLFRSFLVIGLVAGSLSGGARVAANESSDSVGEKGERLAPIDTALREAMAAGVEHARVIIRVSPERHQHGDCGHQRRRRAADRGKPES